MRYLLSTFALALCACAVEPEPVDGTEHAQPGVPVFVAQVEASGCARGPGYWLGPPEELPSVCVLEQGTTTRCYATAARTGISARSTTTARVMGAGYAWDIAWTQLDAAGSEQCAGSHVVTALP